MKNQWLNLVLLGSAILALRAGGAWVNLNLFLLVALTMGLLVACVCYATISAKLRKGDVKGLLPQQVDLLNAKGPTGLLLKLQIATMVCFLVVSASAGNVISAVIVLVLWLAFRELCKQAVDQWQLSKPGRSQ